MIQYNKGAFGLNLLFRLHGSAVYRAMFPGFLGVMIYLFIRFFWRNNGTELSDDLGHPYAVGVLVGSVSFLIVFRANHGYSRYWEACGAVHQCLSKWMDAVTHTACYHMQCDHYIPIKPPSYFEHPDLNDGFFTRDRERVLGKNSDSRSLKQINFHRSVSKSINYVEDAKKREGMVPDGLVVDSDGDVSDSPSHLMGRPRLDGGWGELFPKESDQTATFYNAAKQWNHDGKGFASLSGGRTPALFLQELAHLASLLSAVALSTLRNDIEGAESPLGFYEPGQPWPEVDSTKVEGLDVGWSGVFKYLTGADRTPEARTKHNALRPLLVIGGVSDNEIKFLQMARGPYAKTQLAWQWLSEFVIREHLAGSTGAVGPPIISRVIQFVGDGMMFYNQARKIMWIPFPFPHAQMSVFYVITIIFAVPFMMDQYANETWLACIVTFFTVTCLSTKWPGSWRIRSATYPMICLCAQSKHTSTRLFSPCMLGITLTISFNPTFTTLLWNQGSSRKRQEQRKPDPSDQTPSTQKMTLLQLQSLVEEHSKAIEQHLKSLDVNGDGEDGAQLSKSIIVAEALAFYNAFRPF